MRIKVTTSINVRSNTVPPTPIEPEDAAPQVEESRRPLEKSRSKSPIPFLPPLPDMATSRFKATQRPPRGSRLSAWLHGHSTQHGEGDRLLDHARNISHTSTYCYHQTPRRMSRAGSSGLRPTASTRGMIDPVHSPITGSRPNQPYNQGCRVHDAPLSPLDAYQRRLRREMGHPSSDPRPRRTRAKKTDTRQSRRCLPHMRDPKARRKSIGCFIFGAVLAIVLTIYLGLAASNAATGVTFHAVFIFFILVLTVIFMHYLIRLCMLAIRPRRHYRSRKYRDRMQWPTDEEVALPHASQPVPVSLAPDESHTRDEAIIEDVLDEDAESEKELPAPPPIYGNWRGSVRADPDLLHWQLHSNQPEVQRQAREMIFAGSGHRPPSYTSNEMLKGANGSPTVPRPLPLFAERRRAAGVVLR